MPMALAVALVFAFASPVLANSIAPTVYFWPGVLPLTLGLAVPASVLAAFLERPFVTAAGVRSSALRHSLRANAISLVVGYLTLPIGLPALYTVGPIWWSVAAVALSVLSEGWYLSSRANSPFRWGPVVWGNLFSSVVLLSLPYAATENNNASPELVWHLEPHHTWMCWGSVVGGILMFVGSFVVLERGDTPD
jgi:hypothetical protein